VQDFSKLIFRVRGQRAESLLTSLAVVCLSIAAVAQAPAGRAVGTVKSITGNTVVITTDAGAEATITFAGSARIIRAAPGQTDLKSAPAIQVSEIQVGDRLLARGQSGSNGTFVASSALIMSKADVAQRQQVERDEWRRGVGGIVKDVDASGGTITIANSLAASGKSILVHVSPQTQILRYSPDSVKFDDAKSGTLAEIHAGDQLRARGTKNADGSEFTAQAIVSGSFRNLAGTVVSTDAANNSVIIMDLATKKLVTVRVTSDSELRKLPPFVAGRIAMRLKGGTPDQGSAESSSSGQGRPAGASENTGQGAGRRAGQGRADSPGGIQAGAGGKWRGNGNGDFQQMLSRMPAVSISDLNKGDAVMLVATQGSASSGPTAITLLAGVEPILSAVPGGAGAAMILSPWNLGSGEGGGDTASQ
jgi:hypothetical protein